LLYFKKERTYKDSDTIEAAISISDADTKMTSVHYLALLSAVVTMFIQILTGSMPLGAMAGIMLMLVFKVIPWRQMDGVIDDGVKLMGFIAFVMLVASGYGDVISKSGAVDSLINSAISVVGQNKIMAASVMLLVGLAIDMGIGTSFGTVPIIAVLFVPFAMKVGFSMPATIVIISAAAALGDAGSPASDTTLGPSAGLGADGQHDHIWDTCVPSFFFYNGPLFICGLVGAMIL
jgi:predicted histidine transporter YuiF (NhaC family)